MFPSLTVMLFCSVTLAILAVVIALRRAKKRAGGFKPEVQVFLDSVEHGKALSSNILWLGTYSGWYKGREVIYFPGGQSAGGYPGPRFRIVPHSIAGKGVTFRDSFRATGSQPTEDTMCELNGLMVDIGYISVLQGRSSPGAEIPQASSDKQEMVAILEALSRAADIVERGAPYYRAQESAKTAEVVVGVLVALGLFVWMWGSMASYRSAHDPRGFHCPASSHRR